ncbi:6581_t:CDS:2, partial [Cetraspora pellucida]
PMNFDIKRVRHQILKKIKPEFKEEHAKAETLMNDIQSHDYITMNLSKYRTLSLELAEEANYSKQFYSAENAYSNQSSLFSFDSTKQAFEFKDSGNGKIPLEENEQLKAIEDTKVTSKSSKRRKGIVLFIRIFPCFVERIEYSMNRADKLEIRQIVNSGYEKIVKTMFDCLEAISKDEESLMTLEAYAKSVVRRPFGKLLEFFEGIKSLLRTTSAPEEVGFRLKYSKDALKKLVP